METRAKRPHIAAGILVNGLFSILARIVRTIRELAADRSLHDLARTFIEPLELRRFLDALPTWLNASSNAASWTGATSTLNVTGPVTITADPGTTGTTGEPIIQADGPAAQVVVNYLGASAPIHLGGISLTNGASFELESGGLERGSQNEDVLVLGTLGAAAPLINIDPSSTLDLTDNDLIDFDGSSTAYNTIQSDIDHAADGGSWDRPGLTSSVAGDNPYLCGLGYAEADTLGASTFDGLTVTGSANEAVVVKYTLLGDTQLRGSVGNGDYDAVLNNYGSGTNWTEGDFHYAGVTGIGDYYDVLSNYGDQVFATADLPRGLQITPDASNPQTSLDLTWQPCTEDPGGPDAFAYDVNSGSDTDDLTQVASDDITWTSPTSCTITGLTPGTLTYFNIKVDPASDGNTDGTPNYSGTRAMYTQIATPSATVLSDGTQVTLVSQNASALNPSTLAYTWATTEQPQSSPAPTFTGNGTANATATVGATGAYKFLATITDAQGTVVSSAIVPVTVVQIPTFALSPSSATVAPGASQQFTASETDQFGTSISAPDITWSVSGTDPGTIDSSGNYVAPADNSGTFTITASAGSLTATASAIVPELPPTVAITGVPAYSVPVGVPIVLGTTVSSNRPTASFTYQWSLTDGGTTITLPPGSNNSPTFAFVPIDANDYLATVQVTDDRQAATTVSANVITVEPRADFNQIYAQGVEFSATAGQSFTGPVAYFSSLDPAATSASDFSASIDWGDGNVSAGTITGDVADYFVVSGTNTYAAPDTAPVQVTITATDGNAASAESTANIADAPPTVATAAMATPSSDGTSVYLSALGADDAGEGRLTYTWTATGPAPVSFDTNGNNQSKQTTAVLSDAGTYSFDVIATNPSGQSVTSSCSQKVDPVETTISVPSATVPQGGSVQLTATALDQFGNPMATQPDFQWSPSAGSVTATGLYTAPAIPAQGAYLATIPIASITAANGSFSGTGSVTISVGPTLQVTTPAWNDIHIGYAFPGSGTAAIAIKGPFDSNYSTLQEGAASTDTLDYYDAIAGQQYSIRLRITDGTDVTDVTDEVTAPSRPPNGNYNDPALPTNYTNVPITVESVDSSGNAQITWNPPPNQDSVDIWGDATANPLPNTGSADVQLYNGIGSLTSTSDRLYAYAFNQNGSFGAVPDPASYDYVNVGINPPADPSTSAEVVNGVRTAFLQWYDKSDDESGFTVSRSIDGGQTYTQIASLPADTTSYLDPDVPYSSYKILYQVCSYITGGLTYMSGTLTSDPCQISVSFPPPATNVQASFNKQAGTVGLSWQTSFGSGSQYAPPPNGYYIEWSSDDTNFVTIGTLASGYNTSFTDTSPSLGETNYYEVVAYYTNQTSPEIVSNSDEDTAPPAAAQVDAIAAPVAVDDNQAEENDDGTLAPYTTEVGEQLTISAANGVLANDYDPQGLSLTATIASQPADGSVTLNSDGSFTYTPDTDFTGTDTFTYTASNGTLSSDPATVAITVANQPVVTAPDSYSVAANTALTVAGNASNSLGSNDSNPDGSTISYTAATQPQDGTLSLGSDGTFTYTPNPGFSGYDHFSYYVNDGFQNSNVSNVILSVATAPYAPPTIADPTFNPQTFDNNLEGLWNSYIAAKDRLGEVASAMATFEQSALALQNIDPTSDSAGAAIDSTVAKMNNVYLAADRYQTQLAATNNAMGTYLASVWLNTQSVFDVTSAIDALPLRPLGIVPNGNQLATMEAGLQNFATGANILVSYTDFSVKAAETAHALAEGTLQVVGTVTAVGDIFTAAELASEGGCAAVIKAVATKAATTAGAVVVSAAVASDAAKMAQQFGVSEDNLKIGADLLQVVMLVAAARAEAQAAQGGCFAGNTLVQASDGPEPIDQIQIGQRVLTQVAEGPAAGGPVAATDPNATTVDPATWRELTLTMPNPSDAADIYNIQLLEPTSWISNENAIVGGHVYLDLPEMPVSGNATVDSIGACPAIESGPGRVVLGTFEHVSNDVVDITLKGEADPLQVTATHQLWSLDQAGWVEAGDLKPGEQLAGENGPVTVESVTQDCQPIAVYNLDVDVDHQYLVTDLGALAHNVYPDDYDFTVPANYSGYQYSQYLDFTENDNGVYLNDLASGGQLGEIESIAGYGQALPGAPATGSPPKPDFTVEWQDGTTGYGDLYQPTGSEEGVTNEIISKLDQQTAGGAVFVRISSNAKSGATAMYRQAAQNALESSTSGRAVIVVKGNSVLQMFFR